MLQESIKLKNKNCKFGLSITLTDQIINNQELILSWLKEINVKIYLITHYILLGSTTNGEIITKELLNSYVNQMIF